MYPLKLNRIFSRIKSDAIIAIMLLWLMLLLACNSSAQVETNNFEVDIEDYMAKYDLALKQENRKDQADILEVIVKHYNEKGNWDSVFHYNVLLANAQLKLGNKERYLNAYMVNISIADMSDKFDLDPAESIEEIYKYAADLDLHAFRRGEIYGVVARYVFDNVDRDSAIVLLDKAIEISKDPEVEKQYLLALRKQKGIYLNGMGRYDEAIKELLSIVNMENFSLNSTYLRWSIYDELGDMFYEIGDHSKAEYYYRKCIRLADESQYEYSAAYSRKSLAELKLLEDNYDEAKLLFEKSLQVFSKKQKNLDMASAYMGLTRIALKRNDEIGIQSYLTPLDSAISNISVGSSNQAIVKLSHELLRGELYIYFSELNNAEAVISRLSENKDIRNIPNFSLEFERLKYMFSKASGDDIGALQNYERYIVLKDSIDDMSSDARIQVLESEFNRQEQNKQIAVLDAVTQEQKNSLALRNKALIIGGVMLAFLAGLLIGLYNLYRKNKEYQSKLESQNITIQNALAENKVLIKEIHHRVKNNLQVISSLLSLQERKVTDENTKDALKSSKTRVETMSILHQSLYQGDEVREIGVKEYFTQLVGNLIDTYTVNDNISTRIDVDDLRIGVKLINAFANRLDGELKIESGESTKISLVIDKKNISFTND